MSVKLNACPLLEMVTEHDDVEEEAQIPEFDPCVAVNERLAGLAESTEFPVTVIDTETVCESVPLAVGTLKLIAPE